MRVLFVNPQGNFDQQDSHLTEHPDFGGQLVYVKEVSMALAQLGVDVDIVTRRIDDPDWPEFSEPVDYYTGYEDHLHIVRISCGGPNFLNKERLWEHLNEFAENILKFYGDDLPDFATGHYGDGGYSCVLLKQKVGIGFTLTGHSLGAQKLDKLGTSCENFAQMEQHYQFAKRITAERLSMEQAYKIITSTGQERMEQYAHPLYQGAVDVKDDAKFAVIPPGVNTRIFTTRPAADDETIHRKIADKLCTYETKPCVVVSSRFDEKKNHLGAVKAYALSKELQDKANLGIFIRGIDDPFSELERLPKKDQKIMRPLLAIIEQQQLKDKVFFLNIQSQKELASTYRYFAKLGSVFTLTAFYEPFGLAPIEAAACGLAVAATKNGGPSEIFEDGSGILVDPFDPKDMARGFLKGIDEAATYARLGEQRVKTTYTWENTAKSYLKIIAAGAQTTHTSGFVLPALEDHERLLTYLATRS
ncbi:sucrose-phosphate synthase [Candidatus Vecturithrix granuli]|uniref:sucrose-phosphate synthase n=1 Tax=Vecturithrix granuli TaxID=1499967 RepID=A0A081C7K4_VECG1|nr:sucrose-phosphate synthase [Candidatus Vecturithrix granuli]